MKGMIKDAVILFAITLVAGLLLGMVYEVTKEAREEQAQIAKANAYRAVFAGYEKLEDINMDDVLFEQYDVSLLDGLSDSLEASGISQGAVLVDEVVVAKSDSQIIGHAVTVTSKEGYGGDITFTVGITSDGVVSGISILSISETAGLGMEAKEESFLDKYTGKSGGEYIVDKDNVNNLPNEIDAISGATITTRAMTKGVNAAYITAVEITGGIFDE